MTLGLSPLCSAPLLVPDPHLHGLAALHHNPHVALSPPLHLGGFPLVEPSSCTPRPTRYYWLFSTIDDPQPMWEFPSVDGGLPLPSLALAGLPMQLITLHTSP
ncbi:hypothetical protein GOP47_0001254 [Adiantum capillus-veneris]|uniref:Uncharacterized protein n=1 Tax=Adiantum capillus-veneris TaxID=13818 RepID=A0A9D4VFH5_ADICA|nr:hypothetical protein GOP47_0001254 [Adiantum capillus-veneris]